MFFDDLDLGPKRKTVQLKSILPTPNTGWMPPTSFPNLAAAKILSFDVETKEPDFDHGPGWARGKGHIVGIGIGAEDGYGNVGKWYFPMRHEVEPEYNLDPVHVTNFARHWLQTSNIPKAGANLKYDIGWLAEENIFVEGELHDVQHAETLITYDGRVALDHLAAKYLGEHKTSDLMYRWQADNYGGKPDGKQRGNIYRTSPRLVGAYGEGDVDLPLRILRAQAPQLATLDLERLYRIECDLIYLLVRMRREGVSVDVPMVEKLYGEILRDIVRLQALFNHEVGFNCNVNSAPDLVRAFDNAGIKYPRTPKGAPSFTKPFLVSCGHALSDAVIEIRMWEKISSTFLRAYILERNVNGKVYCNFNQLKGEDGGAGTGRFSCVAPWTPIDTPAGQVGIAAVRPGELVWTHAERWRRVTKVWRKGREQMLDVRFSNGKVLTCTKAHRLLHSDGTWITVERIADEYFESMGGRPDEHNKCSLALPYADGQNDRKYCGRAAYKFSQRFARYTQQYSRSRKKSAGRRKILCIKNRRKESYVRQNRSSAPQLDWTCGRRLRISDRASQRQASICASRNNGASARAARTAGHISSSPYRRKSKEQFARQFGACHNNWASHNSFFTGENNKPITIETIHYSGTFEVFDITVEEDHSYASCGVFSHNSSEPNLQNIPVRPGPVEEKLLDKKSPHYDSNYVAVGVRVRRAFIPDYGHHCWEKQDLSQIQYRYLAHFAVGAGADGLRKSYNDDPKTDYHDLTQAIVLRTTGVLIPRRPIKNINFGLLFGMGKDKIKRQLGVSSKEGDATYAAYHQGAPYVKATMQWAAAQAMQTGMVRTVLGRISKFDKWQEKDADRDKPRFTLDYEAALRQWGTKIERADGYKALCNILQGSEGDHMKMAMWRCWKEGVYDYTGVPRITVHDELGYSVRDNSLAMQQAMSYAAHVLANSIPLRVPVFVEPGRGANWGDSE